MYSSGDPQSLHNRIHQLARGTGDLSQFQTEALSYPSGTFSPNAQLAMTKEVNVRSLFISGGPFSTNFFSGGCAAPVMLSAPVATATNPGFVTNDVSTTVGTWAGNPTFTFQWIGFTQGAPTINFIVSTQQSFTDNADNSGGITTYCVVTATNACGVASGVSNSVNLEDDS